MSVSRFKEYMKCEARAKAIDDGVWDDERDQKPLLFGNYVHSYFESEEAHEKFKEDNKKALFSSRKPYGLLSDFKLAEKVIDTLKDDTLFNNLYHGKKGDKVEKEKIVTGFIAGVPFKGKLDSINFSKGYVVDLKTMKSIWAKEWSEELRAKVPTAVNNILGFQYDVQLGTYLELLRQMGYPTFKPFIVAVSKEKQPDKEIIELTEEWLTEGLNYITENTPRVYQVSLGNEEPKKCGHCDYCKSQKKLHEVLTLDDLLNRE
ncbi:MAG: PD-(D/E)XK nuclease-like domain-containing protein [Streptococcus salivarius]|nr:PD-(D/E)XK nuclease-like domain-containing protein [Streptococcus salivarius]